MAIPRLSRSITTALLAATLSCTLVPGVCAQAPAGKQDTGTIQPLDTALDDPLTFIEQQITKREASGAAAQLEVIIAQIETLHHRYHPELIRPLTLLGDAQVVQNQHDKAVDTYARARHIARVSHGLFSREQLAIVYKEADLFDLLGDMNSAAQREEYAYEVAIRAYDSTDLSVVPALTRLADFYLKTYNPISARSLLIRAMHIHQENATDTTPQAVPILRRIAQTHRQTRFPPFYVKHADDNRLEGPTPDLTTNDLDTQYILVNSFPEGERALQKVVEIQRVYFPERPSAELDAILELADWHLLFGRYQAAHTLYNHVFVSMAENSQRPEEYFQKPRLLYFPRPENPKSPPLKKRSDLSEGWVSLEFQVTPNGQVRGLKTVESEPAKLMDYRVRRSIRVARYRPRYLDGQAVEAGEQIFTYRFPYYPLREDEVVDAGEQATDLHEAQDETASVQE